MFSTLKSNKTPWSKKSPCFLALAIPRNTFVKKASVRDLGVQLSEDASFDVQIEKVVKKQDKKVGGFSEHSIAEDQIS